MKYLSIALILLGIFLLAYVSLWIVQLYKEIGYLALLALGDPIYVLMPSALGIILIGAGFFMRSKAKNKVV